MKKVSLMKSMAAVALGVVVASCNKMDNVGTASVSDADAMSNAEAQLGISIDQNQTWNMTQDVKAEVTMNGEYGQEYTIKVYQENPLLNGNKGVLLAKTTAATGQKVTLNFTTGKGTKMVCVAYEDSKGYLYAKSAAIVDGKLSTTLGTSDSPTRGLRAASTTNSSVNIPTMAAPTALCAEILAKSVELDDDTNNSYNGGNTFHWVEGIYKQDASTNYQRILTGYQIHYNSKYVVNYKISRDYTGEVHFLPNAGFEATGEIVEGTDPNRYIGSNEGRYPAYNIVPRTVYVTDGGTWTIPTGQYQTCGQGILVNGSPVGVDGMIIVGNGGKLVVNGTLNMVNQARLIVLPGGEISGTGSINVTNGTYVGNNLVAGESNQSGYNGGTIKVSNFNQNFGEFYNYGNMICDDMQGGAQESTYINHGKIVTRRCAGNQDQTGNLHIKNNCWFEVKERLAAKMVENGASSYIKCQTLQMSGANGGDNLSSYVALDNNSLFEVTGSANFNNTAIIGPTGTGSDYAHFQAGSTDQVNYTNAEQNWINKVYFYAGTVSNDNVKSNIAALQNGTKHDSNKGDGNFYVVYENGTNTAPTEASECCPAYTPNPNPVIVSEEKPIYCYAFEDTKVGDYDMNDVVLKAQESADGTKITLKLVASGAVLNLNIRLYDAATVPAGAQTAYGNNFTTITYNGKTEVHEMLGVSAGTMVNTGAGATARPVVIYEFAKGSYDAAHLPLAIYSQQQGEMRLAHNGQPPFGVIVPESWSWPRERVNIMSAYNATSTTNEGDQSFGTFASSTNSAENWYNHPTGSVMNEATLGFNDED